jgi:hypothetical protein
MGDYRHFRVSPIPTGQCCAFPSARLSAIAPHAQRLAATETAAAAVTPTTAPRSYTKGGPSPYGGLADRPNGVSPQPRWSRARLKSRPTVGTLASLSTSIQRCY